MSGIKIPKPSLQMYIYMQRSLTVYVFVSLLIQKMMNILLVSSTLTSRNTSISVHPNFAIPPARVGLIPVETLSELSPTFIERTVAGFLSVTL